jgi:hypothetical protein
MTGNEKINRRQFAASTTAAAALMAAGVHAAPAQAADSDKWGDLTGKFLYDGKAAEPKKLIVDADKECCSKFDIRDESLVVDENGGLANVYVYVRTKDVEICPELKEATPEKVVLDNVGCIFVPHCMSIWYPEQKFETVNSDPVSQTVKFDPLLDTPANYVLPVGGKVTHEFKRRQTVPVKILCVYHKWEIAYILPRENPYVAISKTDGSFSIPKLPVGTLEFQVWHERTGYLATPAWAKGRFEMEIKPGVNDLGTIKLAPSLFAT